MKKEQDSSLTSSVLEERQKRRREIVWILSLALLFLVLTWIEIWLFRTSQSLPIEHSIFFFGLVNFNIILFLLLFFLIFRNVVKIFSERQGRFWGGTLKGKLIAAFVAFSFIPTTLMFLVSIFYINNSFDRWFNEKMAGVLESSLTVHDAFQKSARNRNYHFAAEIAKELKSKPNGNKMRIIDSLRRRFSLDAVEFYPSLLDKRLVSTGRGELSTGVPPVSLEFLQRGINQRADSSTVHQFAGGDLIRVIVPVKLDGKLSAVVVSSLVPLSLTARLDDITKAFDHLRDVNSLEYPLKSIYLIILVLMTLVILFGASWFGFYLAKQLSVPIEELGRATQRVARGDYRIVNLKAGSSELNQLISNFNSMTGHLEHSEREVWEANRNLKETLARLDEHSRYIEVVLSNVSTGVISVDQSGAITMINQHASNLLGLEPEKYIGRKAQEVLAADYYNVFAELAETMKKHKAQSIGREVRISVNGVSIPLNMTLSVLYDDFRQELGKVLTFDDLSPVLRAQRAAAWTEVARRIAHEIKNPLTPIKLCAERLHKKFGQEISDPVFTQNIQMIIDQVDSLKSLVNEFSNFARLPKANLVQGHINRVLEEAYSLFREAHRDVHFAFEPDEEMPEFRFDPDQMKRAITNLLDNAIAAVQKSSRRDVTLKTQYDAALRMARILVLDSGVGISGELRERIFEPYITTKENGTGLGLAIVKRTIEDHNGFIRALPNVPQGTKMLIEIPLLDAPTQRSMELEGV